MTTKPTENNAQPASGAESNPSFGRDAIAPSTPRLKLLLGYLILCLYGYRRYLRK